MADVFLSVARGQMGFNKLAVIKRLRQVLAEEKAFRTMFLDEARLAARLNHPNIVHTYEVGEQAGVYFIAMEYLEGQSLNKVLKECSRLDASVEHEVAARIVSDALAGLGYAHELRDWDGKPLQVVHRDISPHNIFVTYEGHTKLVDFGIAKAALSSTETEVGILKGKVAYMSPEQALGHRMDPRADLFSMGIVLWELLTQQRLMAGESAANTLHKLINEPIPRVSMVLGDVDPELDAIVARALEKNPDARWQSAADMREALESWLAAQPRLVRHEDVARTMVGLFAEVRAEVQRQVEKYMVAINPASSTEELEILTAESIEQMQRSGATMNGQLLRLGGSGSGSGVIPHYGGLASSASGPAGAPYGRAPARSHLNLLLLAMAFACVVLATILIVILARRDGGRDDARAAEEPEPTASPPAPATAEIATGAPFATVARAEPAPVAAPAAAPPPPPPPPPPPEPPGANAATPPPGPAAKPHGHAPGGGMRAGSARAGSTATPAAASDEPGYLTVSAYPWAKVSENGKVICPVTPCNKVQVSAGVHALTFENGEQPGQKQTVSVVVKAGETATKNVGFK
jgi:serine/threonine-protein kinase